MLTTMTAQRWGLPGTDPFEFARRQFQQALTGSANRSRSVPDAYAPLATWEDEQHLHIEIDVPGVRPDDVDVTFEKGTLLIRGERKPVQVSGQYYDERPTGRFQRMIAVADTINPGSIQAELRDGVLHLVLSKKPEMQPRKVEVRYDGPHPAPQLSDDSASQD